MDSPRTPDAMMADLIARANDWRYSDEWIGSAFRARISGLGLEFASPEVLLHDSEDDRALLERIAHSFANWAPFHDKEWASSVMAAIKSERTRPERMRAIYARLQSTDPSLSPEPER